MKHLIIILTAMGLFTSFFACGQKAEVTMNQLVKDETTTGTRVIVAEMTETEIKRAIKDFMVINENNHPTAPSFKLSGDRWFILQFPDSTPYDLFCYWVNYIVYSNKEKRYNNNVLGWFEVSADASGAWTQFAGQKLMLFVPESDDEFDNVYFTTEDNRCFKQEFAWKAKLKPQSQVLKDYISLLDKVVAQQALKK